MTRPTMRQRVLGALVLGSMTREELTKCLGTTCGYMRNVLDALRDEGFADVVGSVRNRFGRPWNLWGLPK